MSPRGPGLLRTNAGLAFRIERAPRPRRVRRPTIGSSLRLVESTQPCRMRTSSNALATFDRLMPFVLPGPAGSNTCPGPTRPQRRRPRLESTRYVIHNNQPDLDLVGLHA